MRAGRQRICCGLVVRQQSLKFGRRGNRFVAWVWLVLSGRDRREAPAEISTLRALRQSVSLASLVSDALFSPFRRLLSATHIGLARPNHHSFRPQCQRGNNSPDATLHAKNGATLWSPSTSLRHQQRTQTRGSPVIYCPQEFENDRRKNTLEALFLTGGPTVRLQRDHSRHQLTPN